MAGGMDESIVAGIDADMGDAFAAGGGEKHQVSFLQLTVTDRPSGPPLLPRSARQGQSVDTIDGHGQSAAIETFTDGIPTPFIRYADISPGGLHEGIPQIAGTGFQLRAENVEFADDAPFLNEFCPALGCLAGGIIAEADFVVAAVMQKMICVQALGNQIFGQLNGIFLIGKYTHLDGKTDLA